MSEYAILLVLCGCAAATDLEQRMQVLEVRFEETLTAGGDIVTADPWTQRLGEVGKIAAVVVPVYFITRYVRRKIGARTSV